MMPSSCPLSFGRGTCEVCKYGNPVIAACSCASEGIQHNRALPSSCSTQRVQVWYIHRPESKDMENPVRPRYILYQASTWILSTEGEHHNSERGHDGLRERFPVATDTRPPGSSAIIRHVHGNPQTLLPIAGWYGGYMRSIPRGYHRLSMRSLTMAHLSQGLSFKFDEHTYSTMVHMLPI